MDAILRFFEDLSFDDHHLWAIYADNAIQWQVQWSRKTQPAYWNFVKQSDHYSAQLTTDQVIPFLSMQNIDQERFRQSIVESILTMACFAETFQRNAKTLLGEDIVNNAIVQFDEFSTKLLEMTNRESGQNRPELKVMRD